MRRTRPFRRFTVAERPSSPWHWQYSSPDAARPKTPTAQPEPAGGNSTGAGCRHNRWSGRAGSPTGGALGYAPTTAASPAPAEDAAIEAPLETPEAEPDVRPTAGHNTGPTDEPTDQPGLPDDPEVLMAAIAALSPEEQACLPAEVREGYVSLGLDTIVGTHHARILREVADCVDDAGITRLMIIPGIKEEIQLSGEESDCMTAGNSGRMLRKVLETNGEYPVFTDALAMAAAGTFINTQDCLGEERTSQMSVSPELVGMIRCLVRDAQEAEGLTARIVDGDPEVLAMLEEKGQECAGQFPSPHHPDQPECGRGGAEPGVRCEVP